MKKSIEVFQKDKLKDKITMLTCYDYSTAKILATSDIDALLVGDSLGMVFQGNKDTLSVTVDEIIYHTKAVRKGASDAFIVADMPFLSYHTTVSDAIINSGRVIKESGANAVKIEGGEEIIDKVKGLISAKIPVMGHLGLTPQSVNLFGGFKVQGKSLTQAKKIVKDALMLQDAGCFAIVLECIPHKLAKLITDKLTIPTIGIGSGNSTDGQVLVIDDIFGLSGDNPPKFVKQFANISFEMKKGIDSYIKEVKESTFPEEKHTFNIDDSILEEIEKDLQ